MCIILCKCRSTFDATFGWTSRLSLLNTMQLPSVDPVVVTAIVGSVALLLVQPICVSRMYCRRRSTSTTCHSSPRPGDRRRAWTGCARSSRCSFARHRDLEHTTALTLVLWLMFVVTFVPYTTVGSYSGAGLTVCLLALYLTLIVFCRHNI